MMKRTFEVDLPEGYELRENGFRFLPGTDKTVPYLMWLLKEGKVNPPPYLDNKLFTGA